jgi:curved DNA-binding protein CbpA
MSRREFARIFRKKAMAMHPDKGGDHDRFVALLDAYKRIVSTKPERDC